MTTLPKSLSGAAIMLLATLLFLSPADAFASRREASVRAKRIKLLQEAMVLIRAGDTQLSGDRLKATFDIGQALSVLEAIPAPDPQTPPKPAANLAALRESMEKGKADLSSALDTMSQKDIAVANPVIAAINHVDKAIFLVELQERAAAAQAATPIPGPAPDTNAASSPAGGDQVQPVQRQQENSGQTKPGHPAAPATPAPANAP